MEGHAGVVVDREDLQTFVAEYNRKYDWNLQVQGQLVADDKGASGNVVAVRPRVAYEGRHMLSADGGKVRL